ncbi:unnamed protein product [Closterium sp. NIES-54]
MTHVAAPHFLWPFTVRYAAHQLNLWPRVSMLETSPTLHWIGRLVMRRRLGSGARSPLSAIPSRASSLLAPLVATSPLTSRSASTISTPTCLLMFPLRPSSWFQPPPLDAATDDIAATRRSPRLETPPGFPPRPSSPPLQLVAVDSGADGGGDTGGADSGGAGSGGADRNSGGGVVGATAGGSGGGQQQQSCRQEPLSPQQLCVWAVRWGSPGGGAWGAGGAGAGGASAVGAGAGGAGGN